ncbi:MAG TPA: efflux RND transporter periplasmic adaptor subunit [Terracidiphilus sp.]|nr:efflux RND transporter periplasmic adaptor subunit [Terracidiphilus sp.]
MKRIFLFGCTLLLAAVSGCKVKTQGPQAGGGRAMPVKTTTVKLEPVAQSNEYMATIKSRRSATLQPQVEGRLTQIRVRSGDHVKSGQPLMTIDPLHQEATVQAQTATVRQKKALYDYNTIQLERQKKLFEAGVVSRDVFDQAQQAYDNSKADYESAEAARKTGEEQLAYYTIRAPFDGVVGDIPVHVGDYVSSSTMLTTVDETGDLEVYVYIPASRSSEARLGMPIELYDTSGNLLEKTKIDFLSPEVDPNLQAVLAKAPVHATPQILRNALLVKAKVIWSMKPMPVIPVLAVARLGGQSFVYVAKKQQNGQFVADEVPVTLGDTVGNNFAITSGLSEGDQVIVSSTQFLVNGMPIVPLGA